MTRKNADIETDMEAAPDRGESVTAIEPLVLSEGSRNRAELTDLALELAQKSAGFRRSLPESFVSSLAELVRSMNCYYSNLIEGHNTHPIDIERALKGDYSKDSKKRDLQLEAKAHIEVQRWIDSEGLRGRETTCTGLQEVHRRFCEALPENLLWVEDPKTGERLRVVPGELRRRDVSVSNHIATSPGSVPRFLERFETIYGGLGKSERILAAAAAHHRLLWIHPFLDGNGRVARLMSHATLLEALGTGGVWSIARGLARNVKDYKHHLAQCDLQRRNDLDGRGNLSEETLAEFTRFFLTICLDQVTFMEKLVQPEQLAARIMSWADEESRLDKLPPKSGLVMRAVLFAGELERGDAGSIVGTGDRQARRVVSALLDHGVLTSATSRAPLRLAFPAALAPRWMPGLFPDQV
jgi:Fic family protein